MARSVPLSLPWVSGRASKTAAALPLRRRSADAEPSAPLAGMLLAAVLAALLVVADQLIETWANGHLLLVWVALWTVAFFIYWRQTDRFSQLGTMIHGLIVGSILELFVAIGVYAWDPNKESCVCARGSYIGLVFGATVMIWAFGPGLILLYLKKQRDKKVRTG